ncbi:MAG: pseudouridine synthase [Bacteroidales bacterium]|nr:pseudouridine synthase [Bacteroidales bacterium]
MRNNSTPNRAGAGASGRNKSNDRKPVSRNRRDAKPFDRDRKPFDRDRRDAKPFDSDRKPFDRDRRDAKPFDSDRKPFNRDRKPFDGERKPFDSDRKPFNRDRKPFDGERKPFDRDRKPFNRDRKPFDGERKPFDRDRKPFDRDRKPFDRDRKPFDGERKPYSNEKSPVYFDENSFKSDRKPVMRERKSKSAVSNEGSVRLNKFISNSGICSRREADEYIEAGLVTVNGEIITQLGVKVNYSDDIRFNGERLKGEEKVYILMNKPKDYVTTMSDPNADKTVMDIIEGKCPQRVFPVGRLDKMTTGVLLLTNDGDMAEKLTHPSNLQKKIYHVFLDKNLTTTDFDTILKGMTLEDGPVHADALSYVDNDESQVGLEIHSGRNRVVRRIFEHLDYKVKKLDRVFFAGLTKKNLRRGQWRFLTDQEVAMLRMGAYE